MPKVTRKATDQQESNYITQADVEMFGKVRSQMTKLSADLEALSKKSPDAPVSKFKLTFVNEMLRDANRFLTPPFKPIEGFELFDDVALPSNSDSVMVLNQYLTCLENWRSAHIHETTRDGFNKQWVWNIPGESIPAGRPTSG